MKTTLNQIRECSPCESGWKKLLSHLGKTKSDDEPLAITTILDSNGLDDALWCLQSVKGHYREIRLFGVWCARQVQHLMTDHRSINAIDVAERYANGAATDAELDAARTAAWAAAACAASSAAARTASSDAAWAAARTAAWAAAWAASSDAAWAAARTAAWAAARTASSDAARDAQAQRLREICNEIDGAIK